MFILCGANSSPHTGTADRRLQQKNTGADALGARLLNQFHRFRFEFAPETSLVFVVFFLNTSDH